MDQAGAVDDGSNPNGNPPDYLIPGITSLGTDPNQHNDGALCCSDQVQLADGRILDSGGTAYHSDP